MALFPRTWNMEHKRNLRTTAFENAEKSRYCLLSAVAPICGFASIKILHILEMYKQKKVY
jgi:hypothetical protein